MIDRAHYPTPADLEGITMATNARVGSTLRDEGWAVQPGSPHRDEAGLWTCTLVLADGDSDMIHAVTGQGLTAEAARDKATELANRWRGLKAAERSRGKGGGGRWIR